MPSSRLRFALCALLAALAGCAATSAPAPPGARRTTAKPSSLPEFGKPRGSVIDPSEAPKGDLVPYGPLTRADFRAAAPPPAVAPHKDRLSAYTCAQISTGNGWRVSVLPTRSVDGRTIYRAAPAARLAFSAYMDRSCSWWNERQSALAPDYVLQHEQIHFALFELAARRLTARGDEIAAEVTVTAPTGSEALAASKAKMDAVLESVLDESLRENLRFDEDTSFGYQPEAQQVWWDRVQAELARSQPATATR